MPSIPDVRDGQMAVDAAASGATVVVTDLANALGTFLGKEGICELRLHNTRVCWCPYCCLCMGTFLTIERWQPVRLLGMATAEATGAFVPSLRRKGPRIALPPELCASSTTDIRERPFGCR